MGKEIILVTEESEEIISKVVTIAKALQEDMNPSSVMSGYLCVVNRYGFVLGIIAIGAPRQMTMTIATKKAQLSAHTGASTREIADKILSGQRTLALYGIAENDFVPFAGGLPVYSKDGVLMGAVGFSEQSADVDERIIKEAIVRCGFYPHRLPDMEINMEDVGTATKKLEAQAKTDEESGAVPEA